MPGFYIVSGSVLGADCFRVLRYCDTVDRDTLHPGWKFSNACEIIAVRSERYAYNLPVLPGNFLVVDNH